MDHDHEEASGGGGKGNSPGGGGGGATAGIVFEDFFPAMVEKLGAEGFMDELCKGFRLLMDPEMGAITLDSLRKNSELLGLGGMSDQDLTSMLTEGDLDGDGCLNQMEFCVLMLRLSPQLMTESRIRFDQVITRLDHDHAHDLY